MSSPVSEIHREALSFSGVPEGRLRMRRRQPGAGSRPAVPPVSRKPHFIERLFSDFGLESRHYRSRPLERRMNACLRAIHAHSELHACERLREQPEMVHRAVNAVLLGVTGFFRDPEVFESLGRIVGEWSRAGRAPRIWSVGCSDGAELYSVAMLLAEQGLLTRSELLGTDCRGDAIQVARAGSYDRGCLHRIPPALRTYADDLGDKVQISASLRSAIQWEIHDFLGSHPPGSWDLILWRNSAIYLESASAEAVGARLVRALRPGGLLVVGRAERPACHRNLSRIDRCIYQMAQG